VIEEPLVADDQLALRMRIETRSGDVMAFRAGRRGRAGPFERRMVSADDFELRSVATAPHGDHWDRQAIDRAVSRNRMRERLPSIRSPLHAGLIIRR
jgi:hypothetical protein